MLQVLACGAVVFPGLFFALRRLLPCVFKHWSDADVVLISERLVSSIHAVMATTAGVIVVSHWLATYFVIWFGVPYMTYDIFAMYLSHYHRFRVKGHEDYKRHSLRTISTFVRREFLLFFRREQGDFFIGCLFLTELSTPFVSMGKILIQLGLQDCWLHKANGGMVLLTFFMCRIALFPYMYWVYGRHYDLPLYSVPFHLPLLANLGNACILRRKSTGSCCYAGKDFVFIDAAACRKFNRTFNPSRTIPRLIDIRFHDFFFFCSLKPHTSATNATSTTSAKRH
ncbi:hypothetical protein F7725_006498 [Dissostichus mawsoni]|uniref:TLC domain-containing protein n=1 Tax=Dissostichus mawsoni TaxID=36200 RepID=A0A7J5XU26_DISMA|nr:hypothetical protein F7725_006498 [Dissostichus mawsoni]